MQIDCLPFGAEVWVVFQNYKVSKATVDSVAIWIDEHGQSIDYTFTNAEYTHEWVRSENVFMTKGEADAFLAEVMSEKS